MKSCGGISRLRRGRGWDPVRCHRRYPLGPRFVSDRGAGSPVPGCAPHRRARRRRGRRRGPPALRRPGTGGVARTRWYSSEVTGPPRSEGSRTGVLAGRYPRASSPAWTTSGRAGRGRIAPPTPRPEDTSRTPQRDPPCSAVRRSVLAVLPVGWGVGALTSRARGCRVPFVKGHPNFPSYGHRKVPPQV